VMTGNGTKARALLTEAIPTFAGERAACEHGCDHALEFAIITAPDARDEALVARLDAVAGRVLSRCGATREGPRGALPRGHPCRHAPRTPGIACSRLLNTLKTIRIRSN